MFDPDDAGEVLFESVVARRIVEGLTLSLVLPDFERFAYTRLSFEGPVWLVLGRMSALMKLLKSLSAVFGVFDWLLARC